MHKVTCCALSQLETVKGPHDINLFIVRKPKSEIKSTTVFKYLAPSESLFKFYVENREEDGWWNVYEEAFKKELNTVEKQIGLTLVKDYVEEGFNVNLICYCGDPKRCHRSLIGERLKLMGLEVTII